MDKGLQPGITNISDLLINKKITKTCADNVIENINIGIPNYLRPSKRTSKNNNQLIDDIEDSMVSNKDVYRLGTFILHHNLIERKEVYDIVDGRQRIISVSLLLK